MSRMMTVDPNKRSAGLCFFAGDELVHATVVACALEEREDRIPFWLANDAYVAWCDFFGDDHIDRFVGESPGHRGANERANYNANILPLVRVAMAIGGRMCSYKTDIRTPNPDDWKGNKAKEMFLAQGFKRLRDKEKKVLAISRKREGWDAKFTEDATTAALIGLWRLDRLDRYK